MCYPLRMEELDMDIVDLQKAFNDFSEAYQEVNEGQGIPFFPYGYRFSACLCKFLFLFPDLTFISAQCSYALNSFFDIFLRI